MHKINMKSSGKTIKNTKVMTNEKSNAKNIISLKKIAIVSRKYNEQVDFANCLESIIKFCDVAKCDSILFSLYTLLKIEKEKIFQLLKNCKNVKTLFIDEFKEVGSKKESISNHIFDSRNNNLNYSFAQYFGKINYTKKFKKETIEPFFGEIRNGKRTFGNFTILICGETNIIKYLSKEEKSVDTFKYGEIIKDIPIILNPVHDRMIRYEMKLKRKYLSKNRWVISVWNRGKICNDGNTRDGNNPSWSVFHNGEEVLIDREDFKCETVHIGFVNIND